MLNLVPIGYIIVYYVFKIKWGTYRLYCSRLYIVVVNEGVNGGSSASAARTKWKDAVAAVEDLSVAIFTSRCSDDNNMMALSQPPLLPYLFTVF